MNGRPQALHSIETCVESLLVTLPSIKIDQLAEDDLLDLRNQMRDAHVAAMAKVGAIDLLLMERARIARLSAAPRDEFTKKWNPRN